MKRPALPSATLDRIAAMPAANAHDFQQLLRRCRVRVGGTIYTGLWPSTNDAVIDALERFPGAGRIEVLDAA